MKGKFRAGFFGCLTALVLAGPVGAGEWYFAAPEKLNVRAQPDEKSAVVGQLRKWAPVEALSKTAYAKVDGKSAPWREVVIDGGVRGWVFGGYLWNMPTITKEADFFADLNGAKPVRTLAAGERVYLLDCMGLATQDPYKSSRLRVRTMDGAEGWIRYVALRADDGAVLVPFGPGASESDPASMGIESILLMEVRAQGQFLKARVKPGQKVIALLAGTGKSCEGMTGESFLAESTNMGMEVLTEFKADGACRGAESYLGILNPNHVDWRLAKPEIEENRELISRIDGIARSSGLLTQSPSDGAKYSASQVVRYSAKGRSQYTITYRSKDDSLVEPTIFVNDGKAFRSQAAAYTSVLAAYLIANAWYFVAEESNCTHCDAVWRVVYRLDSSGLNPLGSRR